MSRSVIWLCGLCLLLCGCAGYRMGSTTGFRSGEKSIQITPFQNRTFEPRLTAPVTLALRKSIQRDGTYQLSTRGEPDVIVTGELLEYERDAVSFERRDILTARDFEVRVVAKVTAVERLTGRVLLDREVSGRTTLRSGEDLNQAEFQAVPLLADDLARNITSLLADGTW